MEKKEIQGIGSSSKINLKATLLESTKEFQSAKKHAGYSNALLPTAVTAGKQFKKKSKKKSTLPSHIDDDDDDHDEAEGQLNAAWVSLQRKAKQYDALVEEGGVKNDDDDKEVSSTLVDFLQKKLPDPPLSCKSEKSEAEWVEIVDEFGRSRIIRKNESEQNHALDRVNNNIESKPLLADSSADIRREKERLEWERNELELSKEPGNLHYDNSKEIRTMGVGHYRFSQSKEERQAQMDKIKGLRSDTLDNRQKAIIAKQKRESVVAKRKLLVEKRTRKIQEKRKVEDEFASTASTNIDSFLDSMLKK